MPRAGVSSSSTSPLPDDAARRRRASSDWNYANHLVVNGGVIACGYGEPEADGRAAGILADAYDREVVTIDARPILARGGGIHCITQQQPSAGVDLPVVERAQREARTTDRFA